MCQKIKQGSALKYRSQGLGGFRCYKRQKNQIFYIELGGAKHRYHVPLARCIYMGTAPQNIKRIASIICEGLNAVLDKVSRSCRVSDATN